MFDSLQSSFSSSNAGKRALCLSIRWWSPSCKVDCCVLVPSACTAAAKVPWRPGLARAPALSYSFSLDKGRARRGATEKREEGGENESTSLTSIFLMCCQNFDRVRAMARACHTGRARRPCRTCIRWTKGRAWRSEAKEGGVITIFSFFFKCVRVDVRILTVHAQAKAPAPPACKGEVFLPFPVLTAALPQDSILLECRFFSLWVLAGSDMIK